MSLINDALRKARQAAAEHESRQPPAAFRAPKAYPSRGPRRRGGPLLLVLVAAAAGLSGAALVWWTVDDDGQGVTVSEPPVADATPKTGMESQPESVAGQIEGALADPGGAIDSEEPSTQDVESPHEEAVEGAAMEAVAVPGEETAQTVPVPPNTAAPRSDEPLVQKGSADGERVYVLDANLGYASLSLGFIVARSVNPFAKINDTEVYVGSEVAGFVVENIEEDRVTLRDSRGQLVLTVR